MSTGRLSLRWVKARASVDSNDCVEVAADGEWILVRDSKDPHGPVLRFTAAEWAAFLTGAEHGEFDRSTLIAGANVEL